MGKLAERLIDAQRSGVYRVESTVALEEAVALNRFSLSRIALQGIPGSALNNIATEAAHAGADGLVLLFSGFDAHMRSVPDAVDQLIVRLQALATRHRETGEHFFAVFLDPKATLPLPQLYNWHRSTAATKVS
ncbi:MAG: hypothetical protein IH604_06990 [Burkholderiales bacterium]|nr:hypothetical protein [Burkholderiales bacterium]